MFTQILVSLIRLRIVVNKSFIKLPNYKWTSLIILVISAIVYSPYSLNKQISATSIIVHEQNTTRYEYKVVSNDFAKTVIAKWLIIVIAITRGYISVLIIIIINIMSIIKMKLQLKKKASMTLRKRVHISNFNFILFFNRVGTLLEIQY